MRSNRRSVHSILDRPSSAMSGIAGPEKFASPPNADEAGASHKRRTSKAESIVGSIRGFGRKTGLTKPSEVAKEAAQDRPAKNIPLPSSPIDIPLAAPALELDFGPAAFMSTTFNGSPQRSRDAQLLKATDPANAATGSRMTYHAHVPDHQTSLPHILHSTRPVTPSDLLKLPVDEYGYSPPSGPGTPMPGTNFSFEVDGANSDRTDLFERSVTPTNAKERKELRTMCSLDAMAEVCASPHRNDEVNLPVELAVMKGDEMYAGSAEDTVSPNHRPVTPRRNVDSASTSDSCPSDTCPSDMPVLTRQKTMLPRISARSIGDEQTGAVTGGNLITAPSGVEYSGPPSPVRKVELPFRPKVRGEVAEAAALLIVGLPPRKHSDELVFKEDNSSLHVEQPSSIKDSPTFKGVSITPKPPISPEQCLEAQLELQRNDLAIRSRPYVNENAQACESSAEPQLHSRFSSDDDTLTRAQGLLTSDIVLPNYDNAEAFDNVENSLEECASPHGVPLTPHLFHRTNTDKTPSPLSLRSRKTYTAGLGEAEFRFSFDSWLKNSSSATAFAEKPTTPNRRSLDMSIDSVSSTEERQTPQISPTSTDPNRTPSMGNRLEFELTHSNRNMRYNALHQQTNQNLVAENAGQNQPPLRLPLRFMVVGSSEEVEAYEINLADFESAYASSREASPQKTRKSSSARVGSEDSVADSLKDALSDNNELQKRLEKLPGIQLEIGVLGTNANPVLQTPEYGHSKDYNFEYASSTSLEKPHMEKQTVSSPIELSGYNRFSPTSARSNASPVRFSELEVEGRTPSPEQTKAFETILSSSSADSPPISHNLPSKERVGSSDTLDKTLQFFSSPDSGYSADKSSVSPEGPATLRGVPSRYRSQAKRNRVGKPLGELSRNQVQ